MEQERHLAAEDWSRQPAHAGGNKGNSAAAGVGEGGIRHFLRGYRLFELFTF